MTGRANSVGPDRVASAAALLRIIPYGAVPLRHAIALAANGLDRLSAELQAQAPDEDFDGIGVAIEILRVDVLDDLASSDDLAGAVHQELQQPLLERGQDDRHAVARHRPRPGIELDGLA